MSAVTLKIKGKFGQHIADTLTSTSTIQDLKEVLCSVSNIPAKNLHVLHGFPPKPFDISNDSALLSDSGLKPGDTLILEDKPIIAEAEHESDIGENVPGILIKHIVPADNSCLFTSIHYVLNGKEDSTGEVAPWMRQIIAETVSKDLDTFSEAVLGKPNPTYCKWILDDKSWGGAIELSILSNYYGIEIAVVDTINGIINRFGEDQRYPHRVFLMFDGIHYDPLYMEPQQGGSIQTIFPSDDERILNEAQEIAKEAKSSRQFTDVNKFMLKCLVCNVLMNGQVQAQQHAQSTGHMKFGEV